jgi:Tol biopolymer transport system component
VTADKGSIFGLAWTPDGRQIIFSSDRGGVSRLWRIPSASAQQEAAVRLETAGEDARFPSISRPGANAPMRLAYQRFQENVDIRRAEIVSAGTSQKTLKTSTPFIASTRSDDHPQFSPDGSKIVFISTRSGTPEMWVCDSDGSNPVRLSSMDGPIVLSPRWSPDGGRIAFFATTGLSGTYLSYTIGADGGAPARLSRNDRDLEALPSWSHNGRWIYFTSGQSGSLQIWKVPVAGGPAVQLTRAGGAEAVESADGRLLYYTRVPEIGPGLWSVPTDGGEETRVLDSVWFGYWTVAPDGIYFIDFNVAPGAPRPVKFFKFGNHQVTAIGAVENSVARSTTPGFAISPDNRWLLYSSLESSDADLMLVDRFR